MASRKNIFIGIIVLIILGSIGVYYLAFRGESKHEVDPSTNKHSDNDSVTRDNHDVTIELGAKPETNPKDGSIKIVEDFVKSTVENPNTFEFLEWSEVTAESGYWKVRCKYKGVSSFNAEVTTNAWFYIRNHKVVYTKIISKI